MKDETLIQNLIKAGKSNQLEFRAAVNKEDIAKVLCSFLNGNGGKILVGVKENKEIVDIIEPEAIVKELNNYLVQAIIPEAPITTNIESLGSKRILILEVYSGSKQPYIFDGNIYYRKGTSTSKASSGQISELIHGRQKAELHWERQPALGVNLEDLDTKLIESVMRESQNNYRGNYHGDDVLEFLSHYGLYQNGAFTNACVVLYAKNPVRFLPQIRVRLTEYAEGKTDKGLPRDEVLEGNLFKIRDQLELYINGLGTRSVFDPQQMKRIDFRYPVKALQEGMVNAIIHRDYSSVSGGVAISVYPDRLVISNSGHFPDGLTIRDIKKEHRSHPVNPDIAHQVFLRGHIDKIGRSISMLIDLCRDANLKDPAWKDTKEGVSLTFYGPKLLPVKKDRSLYDGLNDGLNDGLSDGINKFLDDGINDGLFDGISDGIRIEIIRIIHAVNDNPGINTNTIVNIIGRSKPTVERYIRMARQAGLISYVGSLKTGGYELTDRLKKEIK